MHDVKRVSAHMCILTFVFIELREEWGYVQICLIISSIFYLTLNPFYNYDTCMQLLPVQETYEKEGHTFEN